MKATNTLVLGATGKTGRRVLERLRKRNVPVRAGSRNATPPFDWNDPETWPAVLDGIESVYVSYYPDLAAPGAAETIQAFTDLAVPAGVRRLVLLSGRGEPEAERCERIVRRSGAAWTLLRASWFAQNFSEGYLLDAVLAGEVALPAGKVGEPFVDADDIADVAVAALTEDGHAGELYELTGPRLWTFEDAVTAIGGTAGRRIRYRQVPIDDYAAELDRAGLPRELSSLVVYLFSEVLDGRNASIAGGVARALHRAPRDFTQYVRETAATGVWTPGAAVPRATSVL